MPPRYSGMNKPARDATAEVEREGRRGRDVFAKYRRNSQGESRIVEKNVELMRFVPDNPRFLQIHYASLNRTLCTRRSVQLLAQ